MKRGKIMKSYEISGFKINTYAYGKETVESFGYANTHGEYDINLSSVLTRLIQEAGRYCEHYASDLFIDWQTVENAMKTTAPVVNETYLFGFRQNGVDHTEFILCKAKDSACYGDIFTVYRSMWRLDFTGDRSKISAVLGRVF